MPRTKFSVFRFDADNTPLPEGIRCISVHIPDDDAYARLLAGMLTLMNKATNWEGEQSNRDSRAYACLLAFQENDWTGCMDCEDVQDCIENDEGVQGAIADRINYEIANNSVTQQLIRDNYNPSASGSPLSPAAGEEPFPAVPDCDTAKLCGALSYTVRELNRMVTDFLEKVSEGDNPAARTSTYISAIPGVNELPIDEATSWIDDTLDALYTAYASAYDEEYEDTLVCELRCIAEDNDCSLSFDMIYDYFYGRLDLTLSDVFSEIVQFLILGTWTGTEVADLFIFTALLSIKFHNAFFTRRGVNALGIQWANGIKNPDEACDSICEPCGDITVGLWNYPQGFGGSQQNTIDIALDTPFIVSAYQRDGSSIYEIALALPANYLVHWTLHSGSLGATATGEISELYRDSAGVDQYGVSPGQIASDMPNDVECHSSGVGESWYMNSGSGAYQIELTLSMP